MFLINDLAVRTSFFQMFQRIILLKITHSLFHVILPQILFFTEHCGASTGFWLTFPVQFYFSVENYEFCCFLESNKLRNLKSIANH